MLIKFGPAFIDLPQVAPAQLKPKEMYGVLMTSWDNVSGEEIQSQDLVYCMMDKPPGQVKEVRVCKFLRRRAELTLGQMPGFKFYGPIELQIGEVKPQIQLIEEDSETLEFLQSLRSNTKKEGL